LRSDFLVRAASAVSFVSMGLSDDCTVFNGFMAWLWRRAANA
jgi:hypothetical protein